MKLLSILAIALSLGVFSNPVFAKDNKSQDKALPQGLQKKLDRGGTLPPGWERKLSRGEILEQEIYEQSEIVIPLDRDGLLTVRVEGKLIKLVEATREIIEIVELLN